MVFKFDLLTQGCLRSIPVLASAQRRPCNRQGRGMGLHQRPAETGTVELGKGCG